jgi:catechol 2,3-dioxygenase-like lactoylglutathione lyase family enzyme
MVVCSDLDRSRNFYRTILELSVVTDASPRWIELDLGDGAVLALYATTESLAVHPGSVQLGFTVDDVDAFVTDARTLGVVVLQEPYRHNSGRIAVIADPDGYPIQIATPPPKKRPRH